MFGILTWLLLFLRCNHVTISHGDIKDSSLFLINPAYDILGWYLPPHPLSQCAPCWLFSKTKAFAFYGTVCIEGAENSADLLRWYENKEYFWWLQLHTVAHNYSWRFWNHCYIFWLPDLNNYFSKTDRFRAKSILSQADKPGVLPLHSMGTELVQYFMVSSHHGT